MNVIQTPSTRDRLIEAGLELLLEGGVAALTWRKTAARAGVSHAAPAHYFAALPDLLTAIAARAFDSFSQEMIAARDRAGPDPLARLHGICDGYLAFAAAHSGLFHIMFTEGTVNREEEDFGRASTQAYLILRECCAPFCTPETQEELEFAVWSSVHGYAMLGLNSPDAAKRRAISNIPPFATLLEKILPPQP
jgi:AcrR family transcriptional regulator